MAASVCWIGTASLCSGSPVSPGDSCNGHVHLLGHVGPEKYSECRNRHILKGLACLYHLLPQCHLFVFDLTYGTLKTALQNA